MTVRWRLALLAVQLALLTGGCLLATGKPFTGDTWYLSGLLAVVINQQLLEPYYPRPGDVVANSLVGLILAGLAPHKVASEGWVAFSVLAVGALLVAVFALIAGAARRRGAVLGLARSARSLSQIASSRRLYSVVFWLSLIEFAPRIDRPFWILAATWTAITLLALVNWETVWSNARGLPAVLVIEGSIGPSRLLVSAPELPGPGGVLTLSCGPEPVSAVVVSRVHRGPDVWAQLWIHDETSCEKLRRRGTVPILLTERPHSPQLLGAVDAGSTDRTLRFVTTQPLEVGGVVGVSSGDEHIYYQITSCQVEPLAIRAASQLVVRVDCNQLGLFRVSSQRLERLRWVPPPGAAVSVPSFVPPATGAPARSILLGSVIGTEIPILLDWQEACQGHLAILGMTRMGKTSLTLRIAEDLAKDRRVVVLDQTGEYAGKRGLAPYKKDASWAEPGLSVLEPRPTDVVPEFAFQFFKKVTEAAVAEYVEGEPYPRVIVVDEAHQFVPEPAGLGFNTPGRDDAMKFGLLMMQVRKYGIAVVLISQRTAVVAKSALSQCENLIAFKSVDQTGLDYLEAVAGSGIRSLLPQLQQGEAVVFGPAISADGPVAIKVACREPRPAVGPGAPMSEEGSALAGERAGA